MSTLLPLVTLAVLPAVSTVSTVSTVPNVPATLADAVPGSLDSGEPPAMTRNVPERVDLATDVVRVPFTLKHGKIIVEASIDGHGPYPFILDTCAAATFVDPALAQELELEVVGATAIGDPTDPEAITVDVASVAAVTLGGFTASDLTVNLWDVGTISAAVGPARGIIGFPLFRHALLGIDFPKQEILLRQGALPEADGATVLPFTMDDGVPSIELTLGGQPVIGHLDTGSPVGVAVPEKVAERLEHRSAPRVVGHARTANGSFKVYAVEIDGTIACGAHVVVDPVVEFNDYFDVTNVGHRFLRYFTVTFDQEHQRLSLERDSDEPIVLGAGRGAHGS